MQGVSHKNFPTIAGTPVRPSLMANLKTRFVFENIWVSANKGIHLFIYTFIP